MVWGKILACEILVPVQAGAWLILLAVNGIRIENPVPILILVAVASLILILLSALTALHYRERTAAQFIYSTALVVVILLVVAVPENPLNLIVRASVGNAGPEIYGAILLVSATAGILGYATHIFAERVGRLAQGSP
jgi:ABC-type Na+ efflux pump permease subunit